MGVLATIDLDKGDIFRRLNALIKDGDLAFGKGDIEMAKRLIYGAREVYLILGLDERVEWEQKYEWSSTILDELLVVLWGSE